MRPDMGKVITERPRRGMRIKQPKGYKKSMRIDEDAPKSEKIRQKWILNWNDGKEFTDVLGPIVGFLNKNVGRPWSKVCSEISASLPASGGVSYSHARDHLFQMVEERTQVIDGEVYDSRGMPLDRWWRDRFYVDQKGFLRKAPRLEVKFNHKVPAFPKTDEEEFLAEDQNGIWWAYTMKTYQATGSKLSEHPLLRPHGIRTPIYPIAWDEMHRTFVTEPWPLKRWYGDAIYAAARRQLNKREIKRYGLRNKA